MLVLTLLDSDDQAAYPLAISLTDNVDGLKQIAETEFASSVDPTDEVPEPVWERSLTDAGNEWWEWKASDVNTYTIEPPVNSDLV